MMKLHEDEVTSFIQEKVNLDDGDDDDSEADDDTEDEDKSTGAGGLGENDGDSLEDRVLLLPGHSAPSSQQQQVLVPVVPSTNVGVGDTAAVASSPEPRDVFMSTEQ